MQDARCRRQDGDASTSGEVVTGDDVHCSGQGRRGLRFKSYRPGYSDPDQEPTRGCGNRFLLPERPSQARQDGREPDPQPEQRDFGQHQTRQAVYEQRWPVHLQAHWPALPPHHNLSHAQGQPNDNQREENQIGCKMQDARQSSCFVPLASCLLKLPHLPHPKPLDRQEPQRTHEHQER